MRAPLAICARARPEWLQAVADEIGAPPMTLTQALHLYGR
jgi:hypothetical protein